VLQCSAPPVLPPFRLFTGEDIEPTETLSQFIKRWYKPHLEARNPPAKERTLDEVDTAAEHWIALTGDPPLVLITPATCELFLALLRQLKGRRGPTISPDTVYKICAIIQDVLNHAGPAGQYCRHPAEEAGLFGADQWGRPRPAPWFPETRRGKHLPRTALSLDQIGTLLRACVYATQPAIEECTAPAWWSALYRFLFWTGLRIKSAMAARRQWIRREEKLTWLEVPAEFYKGGRPEVIWLHPAALAAIDSLATSDRIFPWPHSMPKHLQTAHKRLLRAAGIVPMEDFGFHSFRRAIGSALYEIDQGAPPILLRHCGGTSYKSYVKVLSRVRGQAAALKRPLDRIARRWPSLAAG
jgi:integrase